MAKLIDGQAANGDVGARDGQCGAGSPADRPLERDQRRAGKARLSGAVDEHRGRDRRQGSERVRSSGPGAGMAKSIVFVAPVALLESRIAWRSEPGPLSAVVSTTKTPSVIDEPGPGAARAVGLGIQASAWR